MPSALLQLWIKLEVTIRSVSISSYSESWVRSKMAGFTYLELLILLFQPCSPAGQRFDPVRQELGDGSQHILEPTLKTRHMAQLSGLGRQVAKLLPKVAGSTPS
jgi:hypothetical protein